MFITSEIIGKVNPRHLQLAKSAFQVAYATRNRLEKIVMFSIGHWLHISIPIRQPWLSTNLHGQILAASDLEEPLNAIVVESDADLLTLAKKDAYQFASRVESGAADTTLGACQRPWLLPHAPHQYSRHWDYR